MATEVSDGLVSSASSCISEAEDENGLNEAEVDSKGSDDDHQLVCLLDAMDHLLCRREDLAKALSKGWMDIASARYSMGPSRINQALFSLKPCSASTLLSVSKSKELIKIRSDKEEDEQKSETNCALQYSLQNSSKIDQTNHIASSKKNATYSNLRQRHSLGLVKESDMDDNSEGSVDDAHVHGRSMAQDEGTGLKQKSDTLAWFGTLVSPHLRTAQTSFTEALGIIVEMASAQSKILAAYQALEQQGSI